MKIEFELREDHRVLLQLLDVVGPLTYKGLQRLFYVTRVESDFKAVARLITALEPALCFNDIVGPDSSPLHTDETVRRILDGLTFLGLIKRLPAGEMMDEEGDSRRQPPKELLKQGIVSFARQDREMMGGRFIGQDPYSDDPDVSYFIDALASTISEKPDELLSGRGLRRILEELSYRDMPLRRSPFMRYFMEDTSRLAESLQLVVQDWQRKNAQDSPSLKEERWTLSADGCDIAKAIKERRTVRLKPPPENRKSAFVGCAFGFADVDKLYDKVILEACQNHQLDPIRVDMSEPAASITEEIIAKITGAFCVIADLTYARPSVYLEVGMAHGMGIPLLLTCRKDHDRGQEDNRRVHFNLEQYKISYWKLSEDGSFNWPPKMAPVARLGEIVAAHR